MTNPISTAPISQPFHAINKPFLPIREVFHSGLHKDTWGCILLIRLIIDHLMWLKMSEIKAIFQSVAAPQSAEKEIGDLLGNVQ